MKAFQRLGLALVLVLPSTAGGASPGATDAQQGRQIVAKVAGLACPFCVYGLEKQLKKIPGVADVHVSLGGGEAVITTKPGAEVTDAQIRDAVRRAGFKVSEIKGIEQLPAKPSKSKLQGRVSERAGAYYLSDSHGREYFLYDRLAADAREALAPETAERLKQAAAQRNPVDIDGAVHAHTDGTKALFIERLGP